MDTTARNLKYENRACSVQTMEDFLLKFKPDDKIRHHLICQQRRCGKTGNLSLILSRMDILTLHWISEKANSGDIKLTGSEKSSKQARHVAPY